MYFVFNAFWQFHPYIFVHFIEMLFFIIMYILRYGTHAHGRYRRFFTLSGLYGKVCGSIQVHDFSYKSVYPVAIACLPSESKLEKGGCVIYAITFVHSTACCVTTLEGWGAVSIYLSTSAIVNAVVSDYSLRKLDNNMQGRTRSERNCNP